MYKSIKNVYCRKNGNNSPTNKADPLFWVGTIATMNFVKKSKYKVATLQIFHKIREVKEWGELLRPKILDEIKHFQGGNYSD